VIVSTLAIQFATLADRKEHEKVVHKRQNKKQRDNDNIAVNLVTMDTFGDCDDEDAWLPEVKSTSMTVTPLYNNGPNPITTTTHANNNNLSTSEFYQTNSNFYL
jgi:hypothetical protein